nr:tetratricopeptide repeat protein [Chitinophagaceae bacterium]
ATKLVIIDLEAGRELLSYQREKAIEQDIPSPALAAKRPEDIEQIEQLYLTGLHLEQYRHATYVASDYYEEALRRDPKDARNNNALGLWLLRRGQFAKAEMDFRKAIATLTQRNPNPYDGEAYYNLGWALKLQEKVDDAFDAFYKSVWNDAFQNAGYLNLARISVMKARYGEAYELIEKSLIRNYHSHSARHLKVIILRKLGKATEALALIEESLLLDPFNFGCLYEKYLLMESQGSALSNAVLDKLRTLTHNWVHNFIEYSLDYAHAGMYSEAAALLSVFDNKKENGYTLVPYYLGWYALKNGENELAKFHYSKGASLSANFIFPNRIEEILILQEAVKMNPEDAKACYYLGNLFYDKRQYGEAIGYWEKSIEIDSQFPTAHRNLALACYNKQHNVVKALQLLERAFALDKTDARVLMELDQLYKRLNRNHRERLEFLEQHLNLVESRDDLYLERITLYNQLGDCKKAKELIATYQFHPWEGGEGKVVSQYLYCHLQLAREAIENEDYETSIKLLEKAAYYPSNLGEGKLTATPENDMHYWKGLAYEHLGQPEKAAQFYNLATQGSSEPVQAIFYNDPQPDKIFYQGLAWTKLNKSEKAGAIFKRLIDFGKQHLDDDIEIDYFAVSLPDLLVFDADLNLRNKVHCLYLMALGNLGLAYENTAEAERLFDNILALDINHQGALFHKKMINNEALLAK